MSTNISGSFCPLCLKYKGKRLVHGPEGCALGASTLCRRCHHRGHLSVDCTAAHPQWERPITLEELIPADIRLRLKINTQTPISYSGPRDSSELSEINTIVVPEGFKELSEFVELHGINVEKVTKPSRKTLLRAVKAWGVANGYRIIQTVEVPTISQSHVDEDAAAIA
jgi:hypothetical protein